MFRILKEELHLKTPKIDRLQTPKSLSTPTTHRYKFCLKEKMDFTCRKLILHRILWVFHVKLRKSLWFVSSTQLLVFDI